MNVRSLLAVGALAIGLLAVACSDGDTKVSVNQPQQTGIAVTGSGSVTVTPDIAVLTIGIEATRETVAEARDEAAQATESLRTSLVGNGVAERDIATRSFNIFPQYSRPEPCVLPAAKPDREAEPELAPAPGPEAGAAPDLPPRTSEAIEAAGAPAPEPKREAPSGDEGEVAVTVAEVRVECPPQTPQITGFTVSNQLIVKVRDIDSLSVVVDDATEAAGDLVRVNNVSFTVDEPEQFFEKARQEAMDDARARAEQLAELAGVTLGRARSITESSFAAPFVERGLGFGEEFAVPAAVAATGFSPGEQEVTLTVSVVYGIE